MLGLRSTCDQRSAGPKMKAMRFHAFGDADVLRYEDVEQPEPGTGEVRIRVAATSFNPVDDGIRGGYLQGPFPVTLPHIPGVDVAGTVDALATASPASRSATTSSGSCPWWPTVRQPSTSSRPPRSWRRRPRASRSPTPPPCRWWPSPHGRRSLTTPG